jgi:hypothetical protein
MVDYIVVIGGILLINCANFILGAYRTHKNQPSRFFRSWKYRVFKLDKVLPGSPLEAARKGAIDISAHFAKKPDASTFTMIGGTKADAKEVTVMSNGLKVADKKNPFTRSPLVIQIYQDGRVLIFAEDNAKLQQWTDKLAGNLKLEKYSVKIGKTKVNVAGDANPDVVFIDCVEV